MKLAKEWFSYTNYTRTQGHLYVAILKMEAGSLWKWLMEISLFQRTSDICIWVTSQIKSLGRLQ